MVQIPTTASGSPPLASRGGSCLRQYSSDFSRCGSEYCSLRQSSIKAQSVGVDAHIDPRAEEVYQNLFLCVGSSNGGAVSEAD